VPVCRSAAESFIGSRAAAEDRDAFNNVKDLCSWPNLQDFGVDVGAAFPIVALGKPAPMPYVWHPRRETERQWMFRAPAVPAKMVEVPNPLKFLG
jgi:hypothetical protein